MVSPVTKAIKSLSTAGGMKNIVVRLSTSSRASWSQVWKQMHSWLSLPISWWEETQREVEKKVPKDQLLFWMKEKNVQGCVSQNSDPMNSILRKVGELGLNASARHIWNSQDASGTKQNSGKKKAIWRHYPKRRTSWAKSLRAWFWGTTTWGNLTTSRLYQQSSVEFGEKICKLEIEDNYVLFTSEGARDTEYRMVVMDSGASMHNAEQRRFWLRYNWYFERGPKPHKRLTATGEVQINE